jgi:nitrate reductase assembly molybdenum cofactor insertion protein NarJ
MAKLKEHYKAHGFSEEKELPDHLSVMLRFLSANCNDAESQELIRECMLPALSKMIGALNGVKENPYRAVLKASAIVLRRNTDGIIGRDSEPETRNQEPDAAPLRG